LKIESVFIGEGYMLLYLFFICLASLTGTIRSHVSILDDITYITHVLQENHPGMYYPEGHAHFAQMLQHAELQAKESARSATTIEDHSAILSTYVKQFDDAHLRIVLKNQKNIQPIPSPTPHLKRFSHNSVWITLPSFAVSRGNVIDYDILAHEVKKYRDASYIIFDLRGNSGGSSHFATPILEKLFGKKFVRSMIDAMNKDVSVHWRASKENICYIDSLIPYCKNLFGTSGVMIDELEAISSGMQQAFEHNDRLFVQKIVKNNPDPGALQPKCLAKIMVIIDHACVSAALTCIDQIYALKRETLLLGQTTNADSIYMESRRVELPSKIGYVSFPIKAYCNRPRGNNVPYAPDIVYNDIDNTTSLEQYLEQSCPALFSVEHV
jgi:Peptidase family S41